jgi:integrase
MMRTTLLRADRFRGRPWVLSRLPHGEVARNRGLGRGGLSARTARYVFTILRSALGDAVKQWRLAVNPTERSTPPSSSEDRLPKRQAWTAPELARFLRWTDAQDPDLAVGRRLLAATGMRRGEPLACVGETSIWTPARRRTAAVSAW